MAARSRRWPTCAAASGATVARPRLTAPAARRPFASTAARSPRAADRRPRPSPARAAVSSAPSARRRREAPESLQQPLEPSAMPAALSRLDQPGILAVLGELEHPAGGRHERGQPRTHRLEQRIAEGLGRRREGEEIGRGVGLGQRRAPGAARSRGRPEVAAGGSPPPAAPAPPAPAGPPRCRAASVSRPRAAGRGSSRAPSVRCRSPAGRPGPTPEARAIRLAPESRDGTRGIHAAAPEPGVRHAVAVQMSLVDPRRAEDPVRLTVEPAQVDATQPGAPRARRSARRTGRSRYGPRR